MKFDRTKLKEYVDEKIKEQINLIVTQLENLKCCGNCKLICDDMPQHGVCDSWIFDGKIKEERYQ